MYLLVISFIVANCVLTVFNKDNDDNDDDDVKKNWHCPADPISYKGVEISTLQGRFDMFLADLRKKTRNILDCDQFNYCWRIIIVLSSRLCLATHLRTSPMTFWSPKVIDGGYALPPTDRVPFHAHTTHSATGASLSPGHVVFGTVFRPTCATRTLHTAVSDVNSKRFVLMLLPGRNETFVNCTI